MATDGESKKLSDLRVVDLRAELEKRGLDKTGVKASLIERLQKALISEGENPDEYEFDVNDKKPIKRLSTSTRSEQEQDQNESQEQSICDSSVLTIETPSLESQETSISESDKSVKKIEKKTTELNKENKEKEKDENTGAESPLNLSIGEEEESFLNSGDEHDRSEETIQKDEDEKTAASDTGPTSDSAKEEDNATKEKDHDEDNDDEDDQMNHEEDTGNGDDGNHEEGEEGDRERLDSPKNGDSATNKQDQSQSVASKTASASNNKDVVSEKDSSKNGKEKDKNAKGNPGRSLWVTNLLPSTRAAELKHLLSRYGKVIGAKVVQSSRYPRQRCYGYVTMETRADADLCIEKLNNTELKGQIIRVAKVRPEHSLPVKSSPTKIESDEKDKKTKSPPKQIKSSSSDKSSSNKKKSSSSNSSEKKKDDTNKDSKDSDREKHDSRSSSRKNRSLSKSSGHRPERRTDILTFDKIREERERQRQRERERAMREEEKRRREIQRAREIEKRQREESIRLEREREKLRIERERLDRQRVEIMRLERERQRLEREKLEQEKQELRRQQMRLEEARRPEKRPSSTSTSSYRRDSTSYTDDRKRLATDRHYEETPPPPRFDVSARESTTEIANKKELSKDYKSRIAYSKRSEEYTKRSEEYAKRSGEYESSSSSYVNREREIREPARRDAIVPNVPPPRISKEARYNESGRGERSPVSYRAVRDERERRPVSEHHTKSDLRSSRDHRYREASPTLKDSTRYRESNSWHSSATTPVKPFAGIGSSANSSRESWSKSDNWRPMESTSNERWPNNSSRILMSSSSSVQNLIYSGGNPSLSGINAGLSCPPPPGNSSYSIDRFDNYKTLNSSRKY